MQHPRPPGSTSHARYRARTSAALLSVRLHRRAVASSRIGEKECAFQRFDPPAGAAAAAPAAALCAVALLADALPGRGQPGPLVLRTVTGPRSLRRWTAQHHDAAIAAMQPYGDLL